ncbi:hypothetical protein CEUSTIGMA_g5296.t1 [Chlamydomonas eustigma]|uniref:Probable cytosolic iron-sulfur protein assembly protein CIAO1 homolog n=1 Tax=Chlamydomonas eustigma TaxID=1157962 RepID=A0A250X446_9CHLO|nr:hypothetical protein CEUSTIGMA_g5296.t1 [Chlamydomonas eustigma]|eukprot:GAX77854.1 hypothetical protein CEUSTIGMA_g5296.t1 [Chlamydomonas eustigma]
MSYSLQLESSLTGHTDDHVWCVAWNASGDQLASCSSDRTVRIWTKDANTAGGYSQGGWRCTAILEDAHTRTIRSCAWSPNGRHLATASFDATTAIWEQNSGIWEQVATLEGHENEVKCIAWSPDGSFLSTCGRDKSVWIWESIPGNEFECVDVKQGHTQDVKCVRWHPSGDIVASCSYDNTIKMWVSDGDDWVCSQTLGAAGGVAGHTSTAWSLSFEPEVGDHMVTSSDDCTLRIWSRYAPLGSHPGQATSPSSGTAAKGGGRSGKPTWRLSTTLSGYHNRPIYSCDWSKSGLIAAGDGDNAIKVYHSSKAPSMRTEDSQLHGSFQWQLLTCKEQAHAQDVNCVKWHPSDPTLLASAGDDGCVKLWRCQP